MVTTDSGSEFARWASDGWAYAQDVEIDCFRPGRLMLSDVVERFDGTSVTSV